MSIKDIGLTMKVISKFIFKSLVIVMLSCPVMAIAELNINGKSSQNYEPEIFSSGPSDEFKNSSITKAKRAAWEKYTQSFSPSKMKSYRQIESSALKDIDDYIIELSVINEKIDDVAKRYTVFVKATINTAKFDAKLSEISNAGSMKSGSGSAFTFVFVARITDSVKSFDEKRTQVEMKEGSNYEKESGTQHDGSTVVSNENKNISKTTTGGSATKKSDRVVYKILSSDDVNTSMNQVLTASGFEVVGYGDVVSECGGTEPDDIKAEFTQSNTISRIARRNAIKGARECEVSYFAVGTVDVGLPSVDSVSGLKRVSVSVKSQVWNINKRLPRLIASVGPFSYKGLGPESNVAQTNALNLAAKNVANEIVNQLNAKGLY